MKLVTWKVWIYFPTEKYIYEQRHFLNFLSEFSIKMECLKVWEPSSLQNWFSYVSVHILFSTSVNANTMLFLLNKTWLNFTNWCNILPWKLQCLKIRKSWIFRPFFSSPHKIINAAVLEFWIFWTFASHNSGFCHMILNLRVNIKPIWRKILE